MNGNNTYGVVKSALIDPSQDVEIFYHYRPSRSSVDSQYDNFIKIDNPGSILGASTIQIDDASSTTDNRLPGVYNLSLPVSIFGRKGVYTIFIRPKEYNFTIKDVGALAAYPDQKGIIIDINELDDPTTQGMFTADNLVGYRVEYFDNGRREDFYRIITSNNNCEAMSQNLTSANTASNGYRYNASGTLSFITLTPSTSPSFKPNSNPFIGTPNQRIAITNTKFDPVMIEVNMVEHDIETLSVMAEGEQLRNLENGRISYYNFDGEVYKQYEFSTIKDNYNQRNVAEIKVDKSDSIDNSLDMNELKES